MFFTNIHFSPFWRYRFKWWALGWKRLPLPYGYPAHDHKDLDGDGDIDCPYSFNNGHTFTKTTPSTSRFVRGENSTIITQEVVPDWVYWFIGTLSVLLIFLCIVLFVINNRNKKKQCATDKETTLSNCDINEHSESWLELLGLLIAKFFVRLFCTVWSYCGACALPFAFLMIIYSALESLGVDSEFCAVIFRILACISPAIPVALLSKTEERINCTFSVDICCLLWVATAVGVWFVNYN